MKGTIIFMMVVLIGCIGNAFACPYKDAMSLLNGDKNSNYARSLRGLFGIEAMKGHPTIHKEEAERRRPPPNNSPPPPRNNPPPPNNNPPPPPNNNPPPSPPSSPGDTSFAPSTPSTPFCIKNNGQLPYSDESTMCTSYQSIAAALNAALPRNNNDLASFYGKALRLAFHDAGEIDLATSDTMGPDGCLSSTSSNSGLIEENSLVSTTFEAIWQDHCDSISRADFWALLGKLVVERADPTRTINIDYQFGRKDNAQCADGANRLPNPQLGEDMFQQVFVKQMGLTLGDAVTLLGAHTLGHVHTDVSGYGVTTGQNQRPDDNAWDSSPASFDNRYYQNMINVVWDTAFPNGNDKNLWTRRGNNQIMLNSDMALAFDIAIDDDGLAAQNQRCGDRAAPGGVYGCTRPTSTDVPVGTGSLAITYASDNAAFLAGFANSYVKMTTVGYGVAGQTPTGKLGTLIAFDTSSC